MCCVLRSYGAVPDSWLLKPIIKSKANNRLRHGVLTVRATKIGQHSLTLSSYVKVGLGKVCVCQITVLKHSYRCILVASVVVLYLSHWLCFGYTKEGSGNIMKAEVETDGAKLLKRHWSLSFPHPQAKFYL